MPDIDFNQIKTDDLLQIIPEAETTEWEFKAANIFDKAHFGEFKSQKLGKIVSSFANSGGGFLLLGKRDGENVFDPVPPTQGRTTMEDHLSLVISQCVAPHYRDFAIFRIPISGTNDSVLVVQFSDSPFAPHQSVADTNYYYRLPGHSVPAPHFHLELLRNRFTKSVLEIVDIDFHQQTPELRDSFAHLNFMMKVTVENVSLQSATAWGVHVRSLRTDHRWCVTNAKLPLTDGTCVRGEQELLLPSERAVVTIHVHGEEQAGPLRPIMAFLKLADGFEAVLRPVSQNCVGRDTNFKFERMDVARIRREIEERFV